MNYRVKGSDIWRKLCIETVFLRIKRNKLRWFWHQIRMHPGHLTLEELLEHVAERKL